MASQMGPKGLARTFEKEKIMRYGKKVFLLECGGLLSMSPTFYKQLFRQFPFNKNIQT